MLPSPEAVVPPKTPPMVAAALKSVRQLLSWEHVARCQEQEDYYDSKQYDRRQYTWEGDIVGLEGVVGVRVPGRDIPPVSQRRPPAVYPLARIIVQRHTAMVFGEAGFPEVHCDDHDTDDFLQGIVEAANLPAALKEAREKGGAVGTGVISYQWLDGEPQVEVHRRREIYPLEWADHGKRIPRTVLKLWESEEPAIVSGGRLEQVRVWYARVWAGPVSPGELGTDTVFRYWPEGGRQPARWEVVGAPVAIDDCPVVWVQNERRSECLDGRGDYEGNLGLLDAVNLSLCGTVTGTVNNVDPTLVLHMDPTKNLGEPVKKGGYNVIFSEKGASYLEQSGSSTTAGLAVTDKTKAFALEASDVTLLDPEKMAGAAQSGEALRRLLFPMVKRAEALRTEWGEGIKRVLHGLLGQARRLLAREPSTTFALPPKVVTEPKKGPDGVVRETVVSSTARVPGKGERVTLVWPPMFPPSAQDEQALVSAVQAANGQKPVISMRTAVQRMAKTFGITDVEQELADIVAHEEQMAAASAGGLGDPGAAEPEKEKGNGTAAEGT